MFTIVINGVTYNVVSVFENSNVAKLNTGQYVPLDMLGIDETKRVE